MEQKYGNDDETGNRLLKHLYPALLENLPDIVFVKNTDLVYIAASQSFANLLGMNSPADLIGKTDRELFLDADLIRRYTEDDHRLLASGKPLRDYIEPLAVAGGERRFYKTSKFPLPDDNGNIIGLYAITRDVTADYKAKLNYEQELRSLFELPPAALAAALFDITNWRLVDLKVLDATLYTNPTTESASSFIDIAIDTVVDDEGVRSFYSTFSQESLRAMFESGKRHLTLEYRRRLFNGSVRWVVVDLHFLLDPVSGNLCLVWILKDIEAQKQAENALTRAAEWDTLTNVYNRDATMSRIRSFLEGEGAAGTHWLFMIDVDDFKLVNDTFGHKTGDDTLVSIAAAIRSVFRGTDIVGRVGGDEFFALMKQAEDQRAVVKRAVNLVEALQYVCAEECMKVDLSGSVGISRYAGDGKTLERLYMEADAALYRAKQAGKNRFAFAETAHIDIPDDVAQEPEPTSTVHLRTLLENMDAAMFQTEHAENGEISVTYSSHNLFTSKKGGLTPTGARGEDIWSVILPEDLGPLKAAVKAASLSGAPFDYICRIFHPAGHIEWRHIRGTHLPDAGDGVRRMIHVATDITQLKQIEAELREKDSIVDFAMRNTDVNLWYFDYESSECLLTKSCQKAHEMPGVEVLNNFPQCLMDIGYVREDSMQVLCKAYERLRVTGESIEFDAWYRKSDNSGWWCERDMLSPLHGADGKVTRCIGIGKNVTAEKEMEEKFHAFQSYRSLAERNTLASVRMNLTTGWCGDFSCNSPEVAAALHSETVDGFFVNGMRGVPTPAEIMALPPFSCAYLLDAFSRGETSMSFEFRFQYGSRSPFWLRAVIDMMKNPATRDVEALYYSFDIDYEKNMNLVVDQLLAEDYEFLGLVDVATGHLMVFGENLDDPEMARNGGLYDEEMRRVFRGLILEEYYDEGVRTMSCAHVMKELETKEHYTCSFPAGSCGRTPAGRKQWKFAYLDSSKSKILMARMDITGTYTAERDSLTGLYNRETFYRLTRNALAADEECPFLLIRFDVDRFKAFNDVCGTQAGDRLLASLGRFAREHAQPKGSIFGRLEADHFVLLVPTEGFDLSAWHKQHMALFENAAPGYRLTSSVGLYEIVDRNMDVSLMCDRALMALRTVKDSYTHGLAWYNANMRERLMREQAMADEMEQALHEGQFVFYLQPQVDYSSESIIGAEALVRWIHPKSGLIPPGEFIPLFEKNGFILKLDAYIWERSCAQLRTWLDEGRCIPVPISVNISRCDLYDPELCERLCTLVKKYRLPFSMLKLEITETAYMDNPEQLIGVVNTLRSMGFFLEMDDFGAGYSSLNMLKDVPVDMLKLDTRFLSAGENDTRATAILSSIIHMAQELGLAVIAEGVETKEQADYLMRLECLNMQGYYFGRPMPVKDFEQLLFPAP